MIETLSIMKQRSFISNFYLPGQALILLAFFIVRQQDLKPNHINILKDDLKPNEFKFELKDKTDYRVCLVF